MSKLKLKFVPVTYKIGDVFWRRNEYCRNLKPGEAVEAAYRKYYLVGETKISWVISPLTPDEFHPGQHAHMTIKIPKKQDMAKSGWLDSHRAMTDNEWVLNNWRDILDTLQNLRNNFTREDLEKLQTFIDGINAREK